MADGTRQPNDNISSEQQSSARDYSPVTPDPGEHPEVYGLANAPSGWSGAESVRRVISKHPRGSGQEGARGRKIVIACNLLVFLTSVCVMVLELTASRLVAKHIGNSIYTWTSVIGVVLAGITLGNFLGGWIADRFNRRRALPVLFLIASCACYSVLWMDRWIVNQSRPREWEWSTWVVLLVAECYLIPALALGTISPVLASIALSHSKKKGMTVGSVYAWGAFGSIVGTFLTGFFLIETWGTRSIIGWTSAVLAILCLATAINRPTLRVFVLCGWIQWLGVTVLALTATPSGLGLIAFRGASVLTGESTRSIIGRLSKEDATTALQLTVREFPYVFDSQELRLAESNLAAAQFLQTTPELLLVAADSMDSRDECRWIHELTASGLVDSTSSRWLEQSWSVGAHLQQIGFALGMRDDIPGDYHDESRYSSITVGPASGQDGDTLSLRLDKLVHSYYSPSNPTKLYYEYEQVYAAVTEQALERTGVVRELDASALSHLGESFNRGEIELPDGVEFDADRRLLRIRGGLSLTRRTSVLKLARSATYWAKITELKNETSSPNWGGFSTLQMQRFPDCVEIPEHLRKSVTYDRSFGHLVAYQRVSEELHKELINASSEAAFYWNVEELADQSRKARTLFLGGGGFIFPRWIEKNLGRQTTIDVIEIDPAVERAVRRRLGLQHSSRSRVTTFIGDARLYVDRWIRENPERHAAYDLVYGDAFQDFNIPWHLTTQEFLGNVSTLMSDDGLFLINLIDAYPRQTFETGRSKWVEMNFKGAVPASWLEHALPMRWISVPDTRQLEFNYQREGELLLRMRRGMARPELDRILTAAGPNLTLEKTCESLFENASLPEPFPGKLPADWFQNLEQPGTWTPIESAPGIEVMLLAGTVDRVQPTVAISFRGVMTPELNQLLKSRFSDYSTLVETLDDWSLRPVPRTGRFLGRFVLTASKVFPAVYVFSSSQGPPGDQRDTFVVVAAKTPLSLGNLSATGLWKTGPFASWERAEPNAQPALEGQMMSLIGLAESLTLTDDFAPVDNLLAPVFENQEEPL